MSSDSRRSERNVSETSNPRRRRPGALPDFVVESDSFLRNEPNLHPLLRRADPTIRGVLVERLQRTRGNTATLRVLQRYEAGEHAKQGDHAAGSKTVTIGAVNGLGGVQVTSGELNALADLYGSPEDVFKADPVELWNVLVLVRRQAAGGKVEESEWDKATGGRYNRLNLRNAGHFGASNAALVKRSAGSSDNRDGFRSYFSEAIVDAQEAYNDIGLPDPGRRERFLTRSAIAAAFAEHFIMDAFSAGHLFNKDDFVGVLKSNLDALPAKDLSNLFHSVAGQVLADPKAKVILGQYEPVQGIGVDTVVGRAQWRPNFDHEFAFKALLEELYADREGKQAVLSALVKVVHDRLSTRDAGGGHIGVEVESDVGGTWVLSGDKTLHTSQDTQDRIDKAIELSRSLIEPFRAGPRKDGGGFAPGSEKVLAHFPRPTKQSTAMIASMIAEVTDPAKGTIPALVQILLAELPSILTALVDRGRIKKA